MEQDGEEGEESGDELDGIFDESADEGTVPALEATQAQMDGFLVNSRTHATSKR